ncbi:MAG: heme-binding protein [Erysipelotrichaceae bacterium]|nr:heme-binding protein [Erysipelotrichaceae bacterium]
METKEALAKILAQEKEVELEHFHQGDMRKLALYLMQKADESTTPLTVRITKGKQIMFHYVANDNSLDKDNWVRRKINSVMNFHHSSLWLHYKTNGDANQLMLKYGLSMEDYTVSGGAVPIIVKGVGVIGAIAISGYSGLWEDHDMGIEALQWLKGEQHEE